MMDCPSCSQPLPDAASFCGHCGASLASEQDCGGCGRSNPAEMRFCLGCGQPLGEERAARQREPRSYTPKHLADKILRSKTGVQADERPILAGALRSVGSE